MLRGLWEPDQVDAREWTADLWQRAAYGQAAEVDGAEPRVLEEAGHLGLRIRVVTGKEDYALPPASWGSDPRRKAFRKLDVKSRRQLAHRLS